MLPPLFAALLPSFFHRRRYAAAFAATPVSPRLQSLFSLLMFHYADTPPPCFVIDITFFATPRHIARCRLDTSLRCCRFIIRRHTPLRYFSGHAPLFSMPCFLPFFTSARADRRAAAAVF